MCHLSMELSDMFDPKPMYTFDKTVVKCISLKETPLKLDLEPKGQPLQKTEDNKQGKKYSASK